MDLVKIMMNNIKTLNHVSNFDTKSLILSAKKAIFFMCFQPQKISLECTEMIRDIPTDAV